jgi:hypothetical protein
LFVIFLIWHLIKNEIQGKYVMSDKEKSPADENELINRREFFVGLKKWSKVVIGSAIAGSAMVNANQEALAGSWINRRGRRGNRRRRKRGNGGGSWINRRGGAWLNRRGGGGLGWLNRRGGKGGGAWLNRRGGKGGGAWLNRRGGGGFG